MLRPSLLCCVGQERRGGVKTRSNQRVVSGFSFSPPQSSSRPRTASDTFSLAKTASLERGRGVLLPDRRRPASHNAGGRAYLFSQPLNHQRSPSEALPRSVELEELAAQQPTPEPAASPQRLDSQQEFGTSRHIFPLEVFRLGLSPLRVYSTLPSVHRVPFPRAATTLLRL